MSDVKNIDMTILKQLSPKDQEEVLGGTKEVPDKLSDAQCARLRGKFESLSEEEQLKIAGGASKDNKDYAKNVINNKENEETKIKKLFPWNNIPPMVAYGVFPPNEPVLEKNPWIKKPSEDEDIQNNKV